MRNSFFRMNKKKLGKLFSLFLAGVILLSSVPVSDVMAEETDVDPDAVIEQVKDVELNEISTIDESQLVFPTGGLMNPVVHIVDDVPQEQIAYDVSEIGERIHDILEELKRQGKDADLEDAFELACDGSAVYDHEWDKYSSNYFYNQLSDEKKLIWIALDSVCLELLEGTEDLMIPVTKYVTIPVMKKLFFAPYMTQYVIRLP